MIGEVLDDLGVAQMLIGHRAAGTATTAGEGTGGAAAEGYALFIELQGSGCREADRIEILIYRNCCVAGQDRICQSAGHRHLGLYGRDLTG